eukprot:scaffold15334_cov18-Tisochrysis_lutea.AAC.1
MPLGLGCRDGHPDEMRWDGHANEVTHRDGAAQVQEFRTRGSNRFCPCCIAWHPGLLIHAKTGIEEVGKRGLRRGSNQE